MSSATHYDQALLSQVTMFDETRRTTQHDSTALQSDAEFEEHESEQSDQAAAKRMSISLIRARFSGRSPQAADPEAVAEEGTQGPGASLPHADRIQKSFGKHDISTAQAHVGGAAAKASQALGATAFATGNKVAFESEPDLHTAAHEAAHVVQQRSGVQLKGKVGQSGDVYEQHADAVADSVVRGESAEQLLSDGPSDAGDGVQLKKTEGAKPPPEADKPAADNDKGENVKPSTDAGKGGTPQRSAAETAAMEADIAKCENRYLWTCMQQKEAVNLLEIDSKKKDPPPMWKDVLSGAVQIALAGGLGAIGKIVELGVTAGLAKAGADGVMETSNRAKVAAKVVASSVQSFAKIAGATAVNKFSSGSKASRDAFWTGQKSALVDTAKHAQDEFIDQEAGIRAAPDGPAQARALRQSLDTAYAEAKPIQRQKSLDEWCNVLSSSVIIENKMGDSSNPGVLGINMKVGRPGSKPRITHAEIEGLPSELRDELKQRPVKDIRVTKNYQANLDGNTWNFAFTANGDFKFKRKSRQAGDWLDAHAKARGRGKYENHGGTGLLVEDIADEKLHMLKG